MPSTFQFKPEATLNLKERERNQRKEMVEPIPQNIKKAWDKWNVRGVILFSLSLQAFLILCAPFRKSTARKLLILLIWSAYLLADWAASFAVGLISKSQDQKPNGSSGPPENPDLLAFWAPFLLLHLGGPDTITAFALEDNELWLRHLLGLIFQAVACVYVFIQSIPNKLWIPTTLMFVAGIIKYVERTRALYLASLEKFRNKMLKEPDPGPNYAKLMEEYASRKEAGLPATIIRIPEPDKDSKPTGNPGKEGKLNNLEVVQYAYKYYNIFRGLVVDLIFSFKERDESRDFFNKREPEDALRIIEVELNFLYEALYTKVEVLHSKKGYFFRCLALCSVVAAFGLFHFRAEKNGFEKFDVRVTYTLLLGGIALDLTAFLMFLLSDWTFAILRKLDQESGSQEESAVDRILSAFLSLKKPRWYKSKTGQEVLITPRLFRRWSGTIKVHDLIGYCLKRSPERIHKPKSWTILMLERLLDFLCITMLIKKLNKCLRLTQFLGIIKKKVVDCTHFIVSKVKVFAENRILFRFLFTIGRTISWLFGCLVRIIINFLGIKDFLDEIRYVSFERFTKELWVFIFKELKRKALFAGDPETAKRISSARGEWVLQDSYSKINHDNLIYYVANVDYDQSILLWHIATELCFQTEEETEANALHRQFSKLLSDYMLYLLIMQPTLMSAVAGIGKIRYRDTCAEAKRFFGRRHVGRKGEKEACLNVLSVDTDGAKPVEVKGDRSKSVLFDASMLAKELKRMEEKGEDKWKIVSRVWVELISYAASHCDAKTHAQQVSKGGELITFIWLLMAHFGLVEQFQINEGHARAKLIIGK